MRAGGGGRGRTERERERVWLDGWMLKLPPTPSLIYATFFKSYCKSQLGQHGDFVGAANA